MDNVFTEKVWESLVSRISGFTEYDGMSHSKIMHSQIFRLAAAIPYLAKAPNPERIAICNLLNIVAMSLPHCAKDLFLHKPADDSNVLDRLMLLYHYDIDHDIQIRALSLLAIIMVNDYCTDMEEDIHNGKYNPVASGIWDPDMIRNNLIKQIATISCPEMDMIMSPEDALKTGFWIN